MKKKNKATLVKKHSNILKNVGMFFFLEKSNAPLDRV